MDTREQTAKQLRGIVARMERDRERRDELIRRLVRLEMTQAEIARIAGLTRGRVHQLVREDGKA